MQIGRIACGSDAIGLFHLAFIAFLLLAVTLRKRFDCFCLFDALFISQNSIICTYRQNHWTCAHVSHPLTFFLFILARTVLQLVRFEVC